jgi:hypothetical protein
VDVVLLTEHAVDGGTADAERGRNRGDWRAVLEKNNAQMEAVRKQIRDAREALWGMLGLLAVAVFAPENKGQVIPDSYYLRWQQHIFHISGWWGWQDHFREIIGPVRSRSPSVTINFAHWWDDWTPVR